MPAARATTTARPVLMAATGVLALLVIAGFTIWQLSRTATPGASPQVALTGTSTVVRTDLVTREQVIGHIGYGPATTLVAPAGAAGGTITRLPAVGKVITRGQALWWIDGRPVSLFYGSQAAYRTLRVGVQGADVQQLEQNLLALGFASSSNLIADGNFDSFDAAAVQRWQASLGVPRTGIVAWGDVLFWPAAVRVTALHASPGSPVGAGAPIVDVTAATKVVSVALNPALGYLVHSGDAVTVTLPDGRTTVAGRVSVVGTVASSEAGNADNQNGPSQSTIDVIVALDAPDATPGVDQAPVTVDITTQTVKNVLAVPVTALLALPGGGYGVEVIERDGRHRVIPVQTGIFDSSRVEVSGQGLVEGMTVVVPA